MAVSQVRSYSQLIPGLSTFYSVVLAPLKMHFAYMQNQFRAFFSLALLYVSVFMPVPHHLDYFVMCFEIYKGSFLSSSLTIWDSWRFPMNFSVITYIPAKIAMQLLLGIRLNL